MWRIKRSILFLIVAGFYGYLISLWTSITIIQSMLLAVAIAGISSYIIQIEDWSKYKRLENAQKKFGQLLLKNELLSEKELDNKDRLIIYTTEHIVSYSQHIIKEYHTINYYNKFIMITTETDTNIYKELYMYDEYNNTFIEIYSTKEE